MSNPSGSGVRWRGSERWAAWVAGLAVIGGALAAACSAAAGSSAARPFVYVADTKRNEISQFRASRSPHGALKPLAGRQFVGHFQGRIALRAVDGG